MTKLAIALFVTTAVACSSTWRFHNTMLEAGVVILLAGDASQTLDIKRRGLPETNVILRDSSELSILCYYVSAALIHGLIANALPPDWREAWQTGVIATESYQIGFNRAARGVNFVWP